ncbi:MAG: tRNA (adenosine(37)-N6)-dimethylallyltransferase MiaA [Patescibacteria group bacterium]
MFTLNEDEKNTINFEKVLDENLLQNLEKQKIIFIIGPTASGKTSLANFLVQKFDAEIFVFDSRQIYKFFNIGTGKDLDSYTKKPKLIDIILPTENFTAFNFKNLAQKEIEATLQNGKKAIVTVGTGLYFDSFIQNFKFGKTDENLRKILNEKSLEDLQKILQEIDEETFEKIDQKNRHRIIRAIEIKKLSNLSSQQMMKSFNDKSKNFKKTSFEILYINRKRENLRKRIDERIVKMVKTENLVLETKNLLEKFNVNLTAFSGIGYKESIEFLKNKISEKDLIEKIQIRTHQYAKRQITWFRKSLQNFSEEKLEIF